MAKFQKKPVVIEAVRFTRPATQELAEHLEGCLGWHDVGDALIIPTREGEMRAEIGDWIIKAVAGEFYPCKPAIFEATYEPVAEPDSYVMPRSNTKGR